MSGNSALASNAGDRYHFVYVARRMLDLLYDRDLRRVEIEGVAPEDEHLATGPDAFLAVDVAEYYGGETAAAAGEVVVIQLKYSPTAPRDPWTLARLTSAPKAVIGKLAKAYTTLRTEAAHVTARIVTNQPLDSGVRTSIERGKSAKDGKHLAALAKNDPVLHKLKEAAGFSWPGLVSFLRDFDLSGFGHLSLDDAEDRLSLQLDEVVNDLDTHSLISRVQKAATTGERRTFLRRDVEAHLNIKVEEHIFPAPPRLDPPDRLFATRDSAAAAESILAHESGPLLVHGVGGVGKTSALQLLARDYADRAVVIVYDCYGNGEGVHVSGERYHWKKFFAQLTNELDAVLGTSILTTTRLSYESMSKTFNRALATAASVAAARGKRLIVAVDAADNAAIVAARRAGANKSFVKLLPWVRWPENCVAVVTVRTENRHILEFPEMPEVELHGFDAGETAKHGRAFLPDATKALLELLHARTGGNARVQARVLEEMRGVAPAAREAYVVERAQHTAFEFYKKAIADLSRLNARNDRLTLATIAEATQPVDVGTVARILGADIGAVETFVGSLAFGLRREGDLIRWRDQDFGDFAVTRLGDVQAEARQRLADFAVRHFESDPYAERNLSRHLYDAGRFEELLAFWLDGDRLSQRITGAAPRTDAMAGDVRHALLAAQKLQRRTDVLRLLALAADLAQGRDVFLERVANFPRIAAREQLAEVIVANQDRRAEAERYRAPRHMQLARALAERGDLTAAEALYERAVAAYAVDDPERRFPMDEVAEIAQFHSVTLGLREAFERLRRWTMLPGPAFTSVVRHFIDRGGDANELLQEIERLEPDEREYAFLGVLARADVLRLESAVCERMAAATVYSTEPRPRRSGGSGLLVVEAAEALARARQLDDAGTLLGRWQQPSTPPFDDEGIRELLRHAALAEVLKGSAFDAAAIAEGNRSIGRHDLVRHYESVRCRTRAWAGRALSSESDIDSALLLWQERHWLEQPRSALPYVARDLADAVLMLPGRRPERIAAIVALLEDEFDDASKRQYHFVADALSRDDRYLGDAEKLIRRALEVLQPRNTRFFLLQAILDLDEPAARIDRGLAKEVLSRARAAANSIDETIAARAGALLNVADAACGASGITTSDLWRVASVIEYERQKASEPHPEHYRRILTRLSAMESAAAFAIAEAWDQAAVLEIADAMPAIARGLKDVSPRALCVLAEMTGPNEAIPVLEHALGAAPEHVRPQVFRHVAAYAMRQPGRERYQLLQQLVERLAVPDAVAADARAIVEAATAADVVSDGLGSFDLLQRRRVRVVLDDVRAELAVSPPRAFEAFRRVLAQEPSVSHHELAPLALELADALPSAQAKELVDLLAGHAAASIAGPSFLPMFAGLAVGPGLRETVRAATRRFLTQENLREVQLFRGEEFDALRESWAADAKLFDALAEALGNDADRIGAEALYRWVGRLSLLLPADVALTALRRLLDRMEADVPCARAPSWRSADSALHAAVRALADLLGHPRVADRWRAVYALVDLIVEGEDGALPLAVRELSDDRHSRWMTKREWLLFTFRHVALRRPDLLAPYASAIAEHALGDFPHVIIREHAKQTVLAIAEGASGSVDAATLAAIAKVNEPTGFVAGEMNPDHLKGRWPDVDARPFRFDETDVIHYWYKPVADAFNLTPWDVAAIAYEWIVEKWRITSERTLQSWKGDPHKYEKVRVDQGGQPSVEVLQTYAERHGLAVAAGMLVASRKVARDRGDDPDRWTAWLRDDARVADPALPARWLIPPPIAGENYRAIPDNDPSDLAAGLLADDSEWIIVTSDWHARDTTADVERSIRSVLVSPTETPAEVEFHASYDHLSSTAFLTEVEQAVPRISNRNVFVSRMAMHLEFDADDPRWPAYPRVLFIPASWVLRQFGLVRPDPTKLEWWRNGEIAARAEYWFDTSPFRTVTEGTRLALRADLLRELKTATGCDVFCRITRQPARYQYDKRVREEKTLKEVRLSEVILSRTN